MEPMPARAKDAHSVKPTKSRRGFARRAPGGLPGFACFLACLCLWLAAARPACSQAQAGSGVAATLSRVSGDVLIRHAGSPDWLRAEPGEPLTAGDIVRTAEGATALLTFPDRGTIKLLPLSETVVKTVYSPQKKPCPAAVITGGRAWARMDVQDENEQFLIITGNAVVNGRSAGAFIEARPGGAGSCLDVFRGTLSIRPIAEQTSVRTLTSGQRTLVEGSRGALPPIAIQGIYNDTESTRSCMDMTPGGTEQDQPAETESGSGEDLSFVAAQSAAPPAETASPASASETSANTEDAAASPESQEQAGEEDEYETIVISGNALASFVQAEAGGCSDAPVISDVTLALQVIEPDGEASVKSASKCGAQARPALAWVATPRCGAISSMSVKMDDKTARLAGNDSGAAVPGSYALEINDTETHDVQIKALDSSGKEAQYLFKVSVTAEAALPPPKIKNLTVNGTLVKEKQDIEISTDMCEPMLFSLEGEAVSDCGEIVSVSITAHELPVTVYGTDEWEASLIIKDEQTIPVSVITRDVTGAQSIPFRFNIDYTKSTTPPEIQIDSVGGYPVSTFGEPMDVYRNDLVGGKLMISGGAGSDMCTIKTVEVSVDGGSSWGKAGGGGAWSYGFNPRDGDYEIMARSIDNDGNLSDEMFAPIEMTYFSKTREEILQEAFETLVRAYQDRDADTFLEGTASSYSSSGDSIEDRSRLDSALNGRFLDISSVYLRYRVDSVTVSGSSGRVTFQWDANPATSGYSKTGTFVFQKQGRPDWKMLTVEDSRSFLRYTSIAESLDLTSSVTALTANNTDTATLIATIKDSAGNAIRNGTPVQFTASSGTIDASVSASDGQATVSYTASDVIGPVTITATSGGVSSTITLNLEREYAPAPPDR